ncbi:MAG TPA: NAD(P)H-binding protein [Streptosporangiaceae bacterium]
MISDAFRRGERRRAGAIVAAGGLILVTGAGGGSGGVGRRVVRSLRERGHDVRAMAHHDDDRADALRALGADVVVGDLTRPADVARALDGVRRMFFGMSVAPSYLEAAVTVATVARAVADLDILVAMSQLTVSQMDALSSSESHHQRLHWLAEQVLDWSELPVVHVRPTVFLDNPLFTSLAARDIADSGTIRLPFGTGRTSPVAAGDVARVITTVLADPGPYIGRILELTGPRSQDMSGIAAEYARALGRPVSYVDVPLDAWVEHVLARAGFGSHLEEHVATMARLHRENRYDRMTRTVEEVTGRPAETVEEFVAGHADLFTGEH